MDALLPPAAAELWPPLAKWRAAECRQGVRAIAPGGPDGKLPLAGRVPSPAPPVLTGAHAHAALASEATTGIRPTATACWVLTGLGSRGLVYHALAGEAVAKAALSGDEWEIPAEMRRWQEAGFAAHIERLRARQEARGGERRPGPSESVLGPGRESDIDLD